METSKKIKASAKGSSTPKGEPSSDGPPAKPSGRFASLRRRGAPLLAKARDHTRSVVTVALAGLATYLVSVLVSIPTTRLLEPWIREIDTFYPFWRAMTAALVLDLPKAIALAAVGYPFGRLVSANAWAAGLGLSLMVYLSDMALGYVVGSFPIAWGHREALLSRLPLALAVMAVTVVLVLLGHRHARKKDRPSPGGRGAQGTAGEGERRSESTDESNQAV